MPDLNDYHAFKSTSGGSGGGGSGCGGSPLTWIVEICLILQILSIIMD